MSQPADARTLHDVPLKYHAALDLFNEFTPEGTPESMFEGMRLMRELVRAAVDYINELEARDA